LKTTHSIRFLAQTEHKYLMNNNIQKLVQIRPLFPIFKEKLIIE
jgi:hypothetical protein